MKIVINYEKGIIDYIEDIHHYVAIISIVSNLDRKINFKEYSSYVKDILYLSFLDIDETDKYVNKKKWAKEKDFSQLKSFLDNISNIDELLICCEGGISRSPGLATAICKYYNIDDSYIWKERAYHANIHVYKLACNLLKLDYTKEEINKLIEIRSQHSTFCGNDRELKDF